MKKPLTNDQAIKSLIKDLSSIELALLRERLLCVSDLTRKDIAKNGDKWENHIIPSSMYVHLCDKIDKHLNFDK